MARYWFGDGVTDWTMSYGDGVTIPGAVAQDAIAVGGVSVTFWNARSGGTRYMDLFTEAGDAADRIVSSAGDDGRGLGQIPRFRGPDNVRELWASAGGGPRALMVGRVDAVDKAGDRMVGPLVLADGSPAASQAYAVAKSGDTMTGPLTLPGAPTAPLHAATKAYVDAGGAAAVSSVNGKSGAVTLTAADVGAAAAGHTHTMAQVTGLDDALAGKAAIAHDHPDKMRAFVHNGTAYVPATSAAVYSGPVDPGNVPDGSVWVDTSA